MEILQALARELPITVMDLSVWASIGQALLFGLVCLLVGVVISRSVGLLGAGAPRGEVVGVGLASGVIVLAAWWAALASGGRSSFTPVALGFLGALILATIRRVRRGSAAEATTSVDSSAQKMGSTSSRIRSAIVVATASGVFFAAVALLYGSTIAPSPRDSAQPIEFNDVAFYSILGADLASTGTETTFSPSGFGRLDGVPPQMWYHWGELWLASAVITAFEPSPIAARHFVVLPVLLLAAAALSGTFVRRVARTDSRRAFLFGFVACLFLAPIPLIPGPFFSSWAVGMVSGITIYGLAAVVVLLALYSLTVMRDRSPSWMLPVFVANVLASIVPAHLVIALLSFIGVGGVWAVRIAVSIQSVRRIPVPTTVWARTLSVGAFVVAATLLWGFLTEHGMAPSNPPPVAPFNETWRDSLAITVMGAGILLAIIPAWFLFRTEDRQLADLCLGSGVILLGGALIWGARMSQFTMFYFFYAGLATIVTPIAAACAWKILARLRSANRLRLAAAAMALCLIQVELGIGVTILSLQRFGPPTQYEPVALSVLSAIRALPEDAKIAYACRPLEELGFVGSALLSINAHSSRPVVPMCFEAEVLSTLVGLEPSAETENAYFKWAPQRALYPDSSADPRPAAVLEFLRSHGIEYIYADEYHPNSLVDGAIPVVAENGSELLAIP